MKTADPIDSALAELISLKKFLSRSKATVVESVDEVAAVKSTALSWFQSHRPSCATGVPELDEQYRTLLEASSRRSRRNKYFSIVKNLSALLIKTRSEILMPTPIVLTADTPPSFGKFVGNIKMQALLVQRWEECTRCLSGNAPLAATVMMGGLLEALLLAKINGLADKTLVFQSTAAPKGKDGKVKQLQEWMLKDYISVAHSLKWISLSAKDVGEVLRDYRNYIHPFKQLSHDVSLSLQDATLLWEVTKSISRQIIT